MASGHVHRDETQLHATSSTEGENRRGEEEGRKRGEEERGGRERGREEREEGDGGRE